jgi:hypothetical protein
MLPPNNRKVTNRHFVLPLYNWVQTKPVIPRLYLKFKINHLFPECIFFGCFITFMTIKSTKSEKIYQKTV